MERFTKMLFAGLNMGTNAGDNTFSTTKSHRFVPEGLPYIKLRINSKFKNFGESVSTSTNEQGFVDYYMLFNTVGHSGVDENDSVFLEGFENGFYEMASLGNNLPISAIVSYLRNLNSIGDFSSQDVSEFRQFLDSGNYIQRRFSTSK